jgi:hypothetical protein
MNMTDQTGRRTPTDRFSLIVGLLFTAFAAGALFLAFGGEVHRTVLKIALPAFLVALGTTGLLVSRRA